jgi:hypothetical protein
MVCLCVIEEKENGPTACFLEIFGKHSKDGSMFDVMTRELGGRGIGALLAFLLGGLVSWGLGRWRRMRQRRSILRGDARDTVVIEYHIAEAAEGPDPEHPGLTRTVPSALRIRAVGQSELNRVVPNGHLAAAFLGRARRMTPGQTLISMEGAEGSYLLETLTGFVGDRVGNQGFAHDLYVMAPCCEPRELAQHQPIVIVLIAASDLALFDSWPACRNIRVEHGSEGARVLTLIELARRYREEQSRIAQLRQEGKRTQYAETMYVLDLALDRRTSPIPTKPVSWGRFEQVLKGMGLE